MFRRVLGIVAGAFSLAVLVRSGFHLTFDPPFAQLLQLYDAALGLAFGLVTAAIVGAFAWLNGHLGWDLALYAHWKHVFVLTWLYFGWVAKKHLSERSATVSARFPRRAVQGLWIERPQIELALVRMLWTLFISFLSAVTAGTIDLNDASAAWLIPTCALAGYMLIFAGLDAYLATQAATFVRDRWTSRFWSSFKNIPPRILAGSLLIAFCTQASRLTSLRDTPNPGLTGLFALVIFLTLWSLFHAVWGGRGLRAEGRAWSLGGRTAVAANAAELDYRPNRGPAESPYFDRRPEREAEPADVFRPTELVGLKQLPVGALLPEALILLGTLVLFSLAFL
jgi:hypothetical protein